ncbi:unnamed protein product [Cladocopium goreaui]|uniref:Canalicular multispecific organic anion transporter 1 n=1 Tax=Cladocopium goreaui TaxID=2562237 RepID=A0A9P1D2Y3_9DINO|nr:unnamed protein product [Cladocopium goreaui]
MDEKLPPQPEPVAQLDLLCIFGGMGCWYFAKEQLGESWALKILPRRAWAVQLCGAALMAGSVSLRTSSMERFRVHRTPLTHQFEWSRNPMYLSMLGNIGSVGLMANTWWCLAAMLPFAAYLNFCIVPAEEIYLRARFGSSYEGYMQRTPRWLV